VLCFRGKVNVLFPEIDTPCFGERLLFVPDQCVLDFVIFLHLHGFLLVRVKVTALSLEGHKILFHFFGTIVISIFVFRH